MDECTTGMVTMNRRIIKVSFRHGVWTLEVFLFLLVNSDEKSMGYDPNDPNLVDEPDLDVENPYEGLGPGRPDPVSRVLMPTAGRQSPDSIGHGIYLVFSPLSFVVLVSCFASAFPNQLF